MTLLKLSKALVNNDASGEKNFGVLTGQVMFATYEGKHHNHWVDLAAYSAIVDMKGTSRYMKTWQRNVHVDDWGRIERTQFWG